MSGGGITVVATISGVYHRANLPWVPDWVVAIDRPMAEMVALAGNMIRQGSAKNATAGTAAFSGGIDFDQAAILETIDDGASSVFLSDGIRVYEAQMDAKIKPTIQGGKRHAEIAFRIIRQVLP